jgi:hypothetical protein
MKKKGMEAAILESSIDSNTTITDLTDDIFSIVPALAVPDSLITTILEEPNNEVKVLEIGPPGKESKSLDNISASMTLTNHNRKSSHHTIHAASTDTKSSLSNNNRGDIFGPGLSSSATQLLLMQLMLQWKENKRNIDDLMKKSLDLSRIIQESIEPFLGMVGCPFLHGSMY